MRTSLGTMDERTEYLSVDNIGTWHPSDKYLPKPTPPSTFSKAARKALRNHNDAKSGSNKENIPQGGRAPVEVNEYGEQMTTPVLNPFQGRWYKVFYDKLNEDAKRWLDIRNAMGKGMCHIVVRWQEAKGDSRGIVDLSALLSSFGAGGDAINSAVKGGADTEMSGTIDGANTDVTMLDSDLVDALPGGGAGSAGGENVGKGGKKSKRQHGKK
jgi:hypothetical protein